MAPVIRISDEVFRRLQTYSVPLVDTPSSVIEKVLDLLDQKEKRMQTEKNAIVESGHVANDRPGLYLAPAHSENLQDTVLNTVPIVQLRDVLSESDIEAIRNASYDAPEIRAWAMTRNSRALFSVMRPGDVVMFTEKGTGKFEYASRVLLKLESRKLGERLWRDVPNLPWELIYLLGEVSRINVSKSQVLNELGYDPNFVVPGITRVPSEKLTVAMSRPGLVEKVITSLAVVTAK